METRLYHGLPAILKDQNWVVISKDFSEIVRIPKEQIEDIEILNKLKARNFFTPRIQEGNSEKKVSLVTLITTSNCNLACKYCFVNSGETASYMSEDIAHAAIRRAIKNASQKVLSIAFFGGEPTIYPNLIKQSVSYARKAILDTDIQGVEFSITTNGVISEELLDYIISNNFLITLSLDGSPKIQDFQRPLKNGGNSSPLVERTLRALVKNKIDFKIRATVTEYSINDMVTFIEYLSQFGAQKVQFEPISLAGRALKTKGLGMTRPSVEKFAANLKAVILKGAELGVNIVNSSFMNLMDPPKEFCESNINRRFAVSYTGEITTCVEVQDKCHPVASQFIIGKYDDLAQELTTHKEERGHACVAKQFPNHSEDCNNCFAKSLCGGGCPVRNFHTTGDSHLVDPYRCQLIKEMIPFIIGLFEEAAFNQQERR